jgi:N-acyl-D-amino-acid deacylase
MKALKTYLLLAFAIFLYSCHQPVRFDVLIKNGVLTDGTGKPSLKGDLGINKDTIAALGNLKNAKGNLEIDAQGLVIAPGFINMLSWAVESLIEDGQSQSDIRQGVTLEVMGEGDSMGPLNEEMRSKMKQNQGDIQYDVEWTTLGEYLDFLEKKGVSTNIASFLGAATVREYVIGPENREPSPAELDSMKMLVREAMEEGAMGLSSALIYVPGAFARTEELIELCKEVSVYDGMYISHLRSEGNTLLEALDELLEIARKANVRAEIYHFKQAGKQNWSKYENAIQKIDSAHREGLVITANMYNYEAAATGLDAAMPPWVQEGGIQDWIRRLRHPLIRDKVRKEMITPSAEWENLYLGAGSADKLLLIGFKNDSLKYLTGKTLAEVAEMRGKSPEETAMDLVIQDGSRIGTVYFLMSEENVRKQIALPWMSFGSDAGSVAPEGVFLKSGNHPRAYGNFARLLGKYVREEKLIPLEEAIRKLTSLPASNLKIEKRGMLKEGYYADIVIFDPDKIQDHATYEKPHQFATGMVHVFVNGIQVLKDGEHTGALPGRVVRGPGWNGRTATGAISNLPM